MIPPVQIKTAPDNEAHGGERFLAVNRAHPSDDYVVISFNDREFGRRDAIGIPPAEAIEFAFALIRAAQEIRS